MLDDAATTLQQFCRHRAGDALRAVMTYRNGGLEFQYVRTDLRPTLQDSETQHRVGELAWENHVRRRELFDQLPETGDIEAVVFSLERAFVIQFPETDDGGLLASFDADAGRFLGDFIDDCRERIRPELAKD